MGMRGIVQMAQRGVRTFTLVSFLFHFLFQPFAVSANSDLFLSADEGFQTSSHGRVLTQETLQCTFPYPLQSNTPTCVQPLNYYRL